MPLSDEELTELAAGPKRTTTDEGTVEERSARDIILLDQYSKQAASDAVPWGIRVARTKPRGTV